MALNHFRSRHFKAKHFTTLGRLIAVVTGAAVNFLLYMRRKNRR